jgi:molybdenum cofactor biosynthesis enzyme MoaA
MKLEEIGFYTLSDERARTASVNSPLRRVEMILTGRCNFNCPYCRHIGGEDLDSNTAWFNLIEVIQSGLSNIRFSGGEPTMYRLLPRLVVMAKSYGIERVAISTNGSASLDKYLHLIQCGVNDFSISLDACCAEEGDNMAGGVKGSWNKVISNIEALSKLTYVTVGIVLTDTNSSSVNHTIKFAHNLGVSDIRVIPAAQSGDRLNNLRVDKNILNAHPILKYRYNNIVSNKRIRGLEKSDYYRCPLVLDDIAIMGDKHYPCIIYMRENGKPIGTVSSKMREERYLWARDHNTHIDPICSKNCLDVCVDYNNKYRELHNFCLGGDAKKNIMER